jgi:ribonuclease PH
MNSRSPDQLRPFRLERHFTRTAAGSVLVEAGKTLVLCTASVDENVPPWMKDEDNPRGWITAEYSMLPGSTHPRKPRDRVKLDGRTTEIQRLVGRSLRAVADLSALGPRQIVVDCDVLQADGGTRTASITGAFVALVDAIQSVREQLPDPAVYPLRDSVAAVSAGIVDGQAMLDLDYPMDSAATVDMNIVMTGSGQFIEIQGTGEESTFSESQLQQLIRLARKGVTQLTQIQRDSLDDNWPL